MSKKSSRYPIYIMIAQILEKKGSQTDLELYSQLKENYANLGFKNLNHALMKMEIEGKITVSGLSKEKKQIDLLTNK